MTNATITNASSIPLNMQTGTVPNMGDSLRDWFQPLTLGLITKTTEAFRLIETITELSFWGLIQPLSNQSLTVRPKGQRQWTSLELYMQAAPNSALISLNLDDLVVYNSVNYRVMAQKDYSLYSYRYYELISDYTGEVPTP